MKDRFEVACYVIDAIFFSVGVFFIWDWWRMRVTGKLFGDRWKW